MRKTTHAIGWQFAARMTDRGLRFGANVLLARMLAPGDFGALAATLVVSSVVESVSYLGIDQAIVQSSRSSDPQFLGTAFRISAFRGVLLALLIFACAPLVEWYFATPGLKDLTQVIALSPLCIGLSNPWIHSERKQLHFRPFSIAMVVGGLAQIVTALICAWRGMGAMSLAAGIVANSAVMTLVGWLLLPRPLILSTDLLASKEFRAFGARAAGIPALIMLHLQAPGLILGRMVGLPALGIYSLAEKLCSLPSEIALPVFGTVLAPAYAQVRDDQPELRRLWLRTMGGVMLLVVAPVTAMVALDERLPTLVYGARYGANAGLISVLGLVALLSTLTSCCGPLFWGVGQPNLDRRAVGLRVAVLAITATTGALYYGMIGFALGVSVAYVAALLYSLPTARRLTDAPWREVGRALAPAGLIGGVTLAINALIVGSHWFDTERGIVVVVLVGIVTAVTMVLSGRHVLRAARE